MLLFIQIRTLPPSMDKWKDIIEFACKTTNREIIGDQLPMKSPLEVKDTTIYASLSTRFPD